MPYPLEIIVYSASVVKGMVAANILITKEFSRTGGNAPLAINNAAHKLSR
jgi:hypothetical protein